MVSETLNLENPFWLKLNSAGREGEDKAVRETVRQTLGADIGRPVKRHDSGDEVWQFGDGAADEFDVVCRALGFELEEREVINAGHGKWRGGRQNLPCTPKLKRRDPAHIALANTAGREVIEQGLGAGPGKGRVVDFHVVLDDG